MNNEIATKEDTENTSETRERVRFLINAGIYPQKFLMQKNGIKTATVTEENLNKALGLIMFGKSLGLTEPMSVNNLANINGRMAMDVMTMATLVYKSGLMVDKRETFDEETMTATCYVKRKGMESGETRTFSLADAKAAGLTSSAVWNNYTKDMLAKRALSRALRSVFPDVVNGLISDVEASDGEYSNNNASSHQIQETKAPKEEPQQLAIEESSTELLTEALNMVKSSKTMEELVEVFQTENSKLNKQGKIDFKNACVKRKEELKNADTIDVQVDNNKD